MASKLIKLNIGGDIKIPFSPKLNTVRLAYLVRHPPIPCLLVAAGRGSVVKVTKYGQVSLQLAKTIVKKLVEVVWLE